MAIVPVSNLLGSPASGEKWYEVVLPMLTMFPIYWVPQRVGSRSKSLRVLKTSRLFPIYWVPQRVGSCLEKSMTPICWGVSNLLGSPASGETDTYLTRLESRPVVSNLLGSPASGETLYVDNCVAPLWFPIYWVPQRVGR